MLRSVRKADGSAVSSARHRARCIHGLNAVSAGAADAATTALITTGAISNISKRTPTAIACSTATCATAKAAATGTARGSIPDDATSFTASVDNQVP